ncbi:MAG: hypothetical protein R2795_06350 [Saprospiraceae bacterium]
MDISSPLEGMLVSMESNNQDWKRLEARDLPLAAWAGYKLNGIELNSQYND